MSEQTHAYCAACREESAINYLGECLWCGNPTVKGRKRGKPKGKYGRLSGGQLRQLHVYHLRGVSIRELGRRVRKQVEFASDKSAAMAISSGFKRLGLDARPQGEATGLKNHLRGDRSSPGTHERAAYKKWLRAKHGGLRPCQGVKLTYPEKGRPCQRFAAPGSEFCLQHDPARRDEVVATVERARAAA